MAINLLKNKDALLKAYNDVVDEKNDIDWAVFGYEVQTPVLKVIDTGDGGIEEMVDSLNGSKIMYSYCKILDPNTNLPKYVLINWQGEAAPESMKCKCAYHLPDVQKFFKGIHVVVNARSQDDIDVEDITKKVAKSSGSNYSFHKEKPKPVETPSAVGSVYQRTLAAKDINIKQRYQFWAEHEKEDQRRTEEEKKRAVLEKKESEQERLEREKREAEERDREVNIRMRNVHELKLTERLANQRDMAEEKNKWQHELDNLIHDEKERALRSEKARNERVAEATKLVSSSASSARELFKRRESQTDEDSRRAPPPVRASKMSHYLMVAAIDFGTTYSGYAFSTTSNFKLDPLKIQANEAWNDGGRQLLFLKTPTCLLLDGRKQIVSFGYEAENDYAELALDDKHHDHYYFSRFKMSLYNDKGLTRDMKLEDVTGKSLLAIEVFGLSIQALTRHMRKLLDNEGTTIKPHEIKWVLTVPAIWSDSAKQFMRKSAEKAGINHDQLCIALEPEAASIHSQYLSTEKLKGASEGFTMARTGQKYMVIDLGGGTADITVHEKCSNGHLKELCHANGGDCGGTSIDNAFIHMIIKILGAPLMTLLKQEYPTAYLDLLREFETVKRRIDTDTTGKVNFTMPCATINSLCESYQNETLSSMIQSSPFASKIVLRGDKMRVDTDIMKSLFDKTINNIVSLVQDVLRKPAAKDIPLLLLVGEFAECSLVQSAMKKNFPNKRIIIPEKAGLSVLKGAVLFGHKSDYIAARVMRFSYGIAITTTFDSDIHEQCRKFTSPFYETDQCSGVFGEIIKKNESVALGTKVSRRYSTMYLNQKAIGIDMYASTKEKPMYVDEDCRYLIGKAEIEILFPTEEKRDVSVEYIFGNTEISMTATEDLYGNKCEATFKLI